MDIRKEIAHRRETRIREQGHTLGVELPATREVPLVPFGGSWEGPSDRPLDRLPLFLAEVKRYSPSKGAIAPDLDAVSRARLYADNGIRAISVLTETDYFGGSLEDLVRIKRSLPHCSVLRKDFLLSLEDIRTSFLAGADAVLLIAGLLPQETLAAMYREARSYGMDALVEVHSREDVRKASRIKPEYTGINSRDLTTFRVDVSIPLRMKQYIDWDTSLVFESGISSAEDVAVALRSGFSGILVGEAVVRRPELIRELRQRLVNTGGNRHSAATGCSASTARTATGRSSAPHTRFFWEALFARKQEGRPLVKICGITNEEDLLYSDAAGADILGFILAPSKRQVTPEFIATLPQTKALKVGVYVGDRGERELPQEITELLVGGKLDCMQFHGDESPGACFGLGFPYYKAFRMRDMADIDAIGEYHCPRVLIDAFSRSSYGGTGKRVADDIVTEAASRNPLWLAGGVTPENVTAIVARHRPELIDVSSGVETAPGRKDKHKIERLFYELRDAATEKERKRHAAAD